MHSRIDFIPSRLPKAHRAVSFQPSRHASPSVSTAMERKENTAASESSGTAAPQERQAPALATVDRRQPPGFIRPCQPVLSAKVPVGDGWIHELKHDGFRIVALKDGDDVRLWSRNGRNWSAEFLANTAAVMALPFTRIVLDGEAVAHCPKGLPDFHALLGREGSARACLYAFDLLHLDADDLRALALVERRALLREHLKRAGAAIMFSDHLGGTDGEAMFRHAC